MRVGLGGGTGHCAQCAAEQRDEELSGSLERSPEIFCYICKCKVVGLHALVVSKFQRIKVPK